MLGRIRDLFREVLIITTVTKEDQCFFLTLM